MSRNWTIVGVAAGCFITGVALSHVIAIGRLCELCHRAIHATVLLKSEFKAA
jgi:hypothetical protein